MKTENVPQKKSNVLKVAYSATLFTLFVALIVTAMRLPGLLDGEMYEVAEYGLEGKGAWVRTPSSISLIMLFVITIIFVVSVFPLAFNEKYINKKSFFITIRNTIFIISLIISLVFIFLMTVHFVTLVDLFSNNGYEQVYRFSVKLLIEQILMFLCCLHFGILTVANYFNPQLVHSTLNRKNKTD